MESKRWGKCIGRKDMLKKKKLLDLNLLLRMRLYFWYFIEVLWKLLVLI